MLAEKLRSATSSSPVGAWDLSYAYYNPPAGLAWNISTKNLISNLSDISADESLITGIFFKPDGSKMYIIGSGGDEINEYNVSPAWYISNTSVTFSQSFSVSSQETAPQGIFFKPDGLSMYVVGSTGDDVNQYTLSTAWNISTASFLQLFSVAGQETTPTGIFFKPDGLKMYIVGSTGDDVNEYNLSTAWNISTASYLQNFSVATEMTSPQDIFFKPDGTAMYIVGGLEVNEYSLSTAWNISTAAYVKNILVAGALGDLMDIPNGIFFKPDGTVMYIAGSDETFERVIHYNLGGFDISTQESGPQGIFFKPDGLSMYIVGSTGDRINQYTLSTAWNISTASYLQNFSVSAQETVPQGVFFKPDGTAMYIVGSTGDDVNQYTLSTPWDVSTASFLQLFSVAGQDTVPTGIFFKSDGLKMYITGDTGDDVNEYNLSTAWDISTASYLQNFSVAAQDASPWDVFFKPDGSKMYILGATNDNVYEYNLSTAWDISTAVYLRNFSLIQQETLPSGMFFKPDGTAMYIVGNNEDSVFAYSLGI